MGALRHCMDGVFEVALAGRRRRGREGRGGTTHFFVRCGRPGRCWPSGQGRQTIAWWDYSAALLLQVAAWPMLQFRRLSVAVMIVSSFLERAFHSTLPFDAAPRCNGGDHARV